MFCFQAIQARKMSFTVLYKKKNVVLGHKNKKFKKWKNCHFSKGVSPWFWSKIGHFSIFCVKVIQARKMCFRILQNEKTPFQAIKKRSSKGRKIVFFPKRFFFGFGEKLAIFPNFFLRLYSRGNCVLRCSKTKKSFQTIKTRTSISGKSAIFPKGLVHGFGQNWPFFHVLC